MPRCSTSDHRILVEVVSGHVQPPVVLREAVDGRVVVCAGDGHKLAHFSTLRLLQFVLHIWNSTVFL